MQVTRAQVLARRVRAQGLDGPPGAALDCPVLDLGVQDTGPDGARWALEVRGARPDPAELFMAWTLRGAPHVYRRAQASAVASAVAPWSQADAAKRIFDASKPLKEAGIPVLEALDAIAAEMREIVVDPTVKGALSAELERRLPAPYIRWCNPCQAEHLYEQPFRLSALRAGLELQPATSPPVLQRIPGWRGASAEGDPRLDPVRGVLRLLGPCTPQQVAAFVDTTVAEIKAHWPADAVPVEVDGATTAILEEDAADLVSPPDTAGSVRLLGPFDLFLQGRDRELFVPDPAHRKDLWRILGRPGGILVGHEIRGSWRPRAGGGTLRLAVSAWAPLPDLSEQAERLAAFRGLRFGGFVES